MQAGRFVLGLPCLQYFILYCTTLGDRLVCGTLANSFQKAF